MRLQFNLITFCTYKNYNRLIKLALIQKVIMHFKLSGWRASDRMLDKDCYRLKYRVQTYLIFFKNRVIYNKILTLFSVWFQPFQVLHSASLHVKVSIW